MAVRRRRLQFSLRMFFVVLTAFALWLGSAVNRAHRERVVVTAIEALGGTVRYDWQTSQRISCKGEKSHYEFLSDSWRPAWMRDLFQKVTDVYFFNVASGTDSEIREAIPYLLQLRGLKRVYAHNSSRSAEALRELRAALPNCECF